MAKRPKDSDVIFSKCSQLCTIKYRGRYKLVQHLNEANDLNVVFRFKVRKKYRNSRRFTRFNKVKVPHYTTNRFM